MARHFREEDFTQSEDLGEITEVHFKATLRISISEPLWRCEEQMVFPNQCGVNHP